MDVLLKQKTAQCALLQQQIDILKREAMMKDGLIERQEQELKRLKQEVERLTSGGPLSPQPQPSSASALASASASGALQSVPPSGGATALHTPLTATAFFGSPPADPPSSSHHHTQQASQQYYQQHQYQHQYQHQPVPIAELGRRTSLVSALSKSDYFGALASAAAATIPGPNASASAGAGVGAGTGGTAAGAMTTASPTSVTLSIFSAPTSSSSSSSSSAAPAAPPSAPASAPPANPAAAILQEMELWLDSLISHASSSLVSSPTAHSHPYHATGSSTLHSLAESSLEAGGELVFINKSDLNVVEDYFKPSLVPASQSSAAKLGKPPPNLQQLQLQQQNYALTNKSKITMFGEAASGAVETIKKKLQRKSDEQALAASPSQLSAPPLSPTFYRSPAAPSSTALSATGLALSKPSDLNSPQSVFQRRLALPKWLLRAWLVGGHCSSSTFRPHTQSDKPSPSIPFSPSALEALSVRMPPSEAFRSLPVSQLKSPILDLLLADNFSLLLPLCTSAPSAEWDELAKSLLRVFESCNLSFLFFDRLIGANISVSESENTLFRSNSIASKAMSIYCRMIGKTYLQTVLGPTVKRVLSVPAWQFEVDPTKLESLKQALSAQEDDEQHSQSPNPRTKQTLPAASDYSASDGYAALSPAFSGSGESTPSSSDTSSAPSNLGAMLAGNIANLTTACTQILDDIISHIDDFPHPFRKLCSILRFHVEQRYPTRGLFAVGAFVFLRYLCPALLTPEKFKFLPAPSATGKSGTGTTTTTTTTSSGGGFSRDQLRSLLLISKVLQNLANGVEFGAKELYMIPLNSFLQHQAPRVFAFLDNVSTLPAEYHPLTVELPLNTVEESLTQVQHILSLSLEPLSHKLAGLVVAESLSVSKVDELAASVAAIKYATASGSGQSSFSAPSGAHTRGGHGSAAAEPSSAVLSSSPPSSWFVSAQEHGASGGHATLHQQHSFSSGTLSSSNSIDASFDEESGFVGITVGASSSKQQQQQQIMAAVDVFEDLMLSEDQSILRAMLRETSLTLSSSAPSAGALSKLSLHASAGIPGSPALSSSPSTGFVSMSPSAPSSLSSAPASQEELVRALVDVLAAKACLTDVLDEALREEVLQRTGSIREFNEYNSLAGKMLIQYVKLTGMGSLLSSLKDVVEEVCVSRLSFEVDPARASPSENLQENMERLMLTTLKLLSCIINSQATLSFAIRKLLHVLHSSVESRFPKEGSVAVLRFLFHKCICPSIATPSVSGLTDTVPNAHAHRALVLLSYTLRNMATQTMFKDVYMSEMNRFIANQRELLDDFVNKLTLLPAKVTEEPGGPVTAMDFYRQKTVKEAVVEAEKPLSIDASQRVHDWLVIAKALDDVLPGVKPAVSGSRNEACTYHLYDRISFVLQHRPLPMKIGASSGTRDV